MEDVKKRMVSSAFLVFAAGCAVAAGGWICPVRFWLNIPCPGCGMSRSFLALLFGDLSASCMWHPMGIVTAAMVPAVLWMKWSRKQKALKICIGIWLGLMLICYGYRLCVVFPNNPGLYQKIMEPGGLETFLKTVFPF